MSKAELISSVEVAINETLKRINLLEGQDKKSLHSEFKEWLNAIESDNKHYDILYINKIS